VPTATSEPTPEPTPEPTVKEGAAEAAAPAAIELEPFANEAMGIEGVKPVGWDEIAPGAYNRGESATDLVRLIQQAAPGTTAEQLATALLPQLGIDALPESIRSYESEAFAWDLYVIEAEAPGVGMVMVDLALAEADGTTYIVLLQALPAEYEGLHEAAFLTALEALAPLGEGEDTDEEALYEHPDGLFTVPIPTNWTVEELDGYARLASPDETLNVYVLAVEADDLERGIEDAWAIVDPEFALDVDEVIDEPNPDGVERTVTIIYDMGDDEESIIVAGGWLHDGIAYVEIFSTDLVNLQKRAAQLGIISSGYEIAALEQTDLSGMEPLPVSDDLLAELEDYVVEKMEQLEVPGAAMAIVEDGKVVYAQGFGVRDLVTEEPVTPETMMMIGSTTKSLTTMLMAQLVDEGAFDWDTPVVEVLPTFEVAEPELTEQITMRNLVCACSGVPRRDFEWLFNASEMSAEDVIESLAEFEFFTDFGEAFQYSNQMVAAGGYIATLAAGGTYGELYDDYVALLQTKVLDPMGMDDSTFSFEEVLASDNYASPYGSDLAGDTMDLKMSDEAVLVPIGPAGALWSNVVDMTLYLKTLLAHGVTPAGEQIVSAENLGVTWEPQVDISADASYGLGWIVEDYHGVPVLSHAGNTFGFTSELAFLPEAGVGISILTNQRGSGLNQLARYRLLELLYGREPQLEELLQFQLAQIEEGRAELLEKLQDNVDRESVSAYLGTWTHDALGEMTLAWQDDALLMDVGEVQSVVRSLVNDDGETKYLTFDPPIEGLPLEFGEDDDGQPIITLGLGVVEYVFERVE
jgi:CubicO group peptidase (beta-lactamase class C family)